MANSRRYKQLVSRIKKLETSLLPNTRISGNYSNKEQDLIRSFILLCHAEVESYFEDRALYIVEKEVRNWKTTRKKSNCLTSIMAYLSDQIDWSKKKKTDKDQLEFRISIVTQHYIKGVVQMNNGIKPENLFKLLLPLGFDVTEFDDTWLIEMENFGKDRGLIAHNTYSVQNAIDRDTELNRIKLLILPEISNMDQKISQI